MFAFNSRFIKLYPFIFPSPSGIHKEAIITQRYGNNSYAYVIVITYRKVPPARALSL